MWRFLGRRTPILLGTAGSTNSDPFEIGSTKFNPKATNKNAKGEEKFEKEETTPLGEQMLYEIGLTGPKPLAEFMKDCLLHPKHGYYTRVSDKIGDKGDFITSPLISSEFFSHLVAAWVVSAWQNMGKPKDFNLIELGAGTGTMMKDMLACMEKAGGSMGQCARSLHINIMEASPFLKKVQHDAIQKELGYDRDINFLESYYDIPIDRPCIVLAHEFFDALPVSAFINSIDKGWQELVVMECKQDTSPYHFQLKRTDSPNVDIYVPSELKSSKQTDAVVEISHECVRHFDKICEALEATKGVALIMDYGYDYEKFVPHQSIRGYRDHHCVEAFSMPGFTDITADVNFHQFRAAIKKRQAVGSQLLVSNTITQRDFLLGAGAEARLIRQLRLAKTDMDAQIVTKTYQRLLGMGEGEMGRIYKALMVSHRTLPVTAPWLEENVH